MEDYGLTKKGKRGNSDIVILSPEFIQNNRLESITGRNLFYVETRADREEYRKEVHTVIEMKYIVGNSKKFLSEVKKDNTKLANGLKYQDFSA
jgi:hypothetical protein